ncbi:MAG: beta-ketoacyl-[acyl-carrier-protein] synthase family protein [Acidobacteria bacterium]|nr:beta-ketoacyl-[acyl-carrier-protein] synthase family protein [Acidobacteriota bacterium]
MSRRRVVVTGLGLATALGLDVETTWARALEGVSGIRRPEGPELSGAPVHGAGIVAEDDLTAIRTAFPDEARREGERRTLFALWAAARALEDAGLKPPRRTGLVLGAGLGVHRLEDAADFLDHEGRFDPGRLGAGYSRLHLETLARHAADRTAAAVARRFDLEGPCATVNTACASSTHALATALRLVRRGEADVVLAGGADSMIHPVGMVFFVLLGAASVAEGDPRTLCRPFDRKRAGLVMGEGAGIVVLEAEEHARARGARVYAELAGAATTLDGGQLTAPHPGGRGAAAAMRGALADASLAPADVAYVNTHGTGTKLNDAAETLAIRTVFGLRADRLVVNSSKPLFGHLLAAAGGPEFVLTILSVRDDRVHPTLNRTNPDPRCDLDCVPEGARSVQVDAALSNSFGFGNQNACVAVRKYRLQ